MGEEPKTGPKRSKKLIGRRKQLERDIEQITGEMSRRNQELAETNKTLSLLQTIDALVLESHASIKMVCAHITEAIAQVTDYPFVGLFTRTSRDQAEMRLYGFSGKELLGKDYTHNLSHPLHLKLEDEWLTSPETSRCLSIKDLTSEEIAHVLDVSAAQVDKMLKLMPLKSVYEVKLRVRRRVVGVLVIGFYKEAEHISEADTILIDRLSETVGVALDNKLLFDENQRVLRQLKSSNTKLQALDEAKDDFISMASHQLRTPLTSVKGYISMVLEGDAGNITPTQKKLLTQSFFSAQRMVYLIADLLNVSRLKTGKFLLDTSAINLADIIEEETDQLKEIAASHSLELTYKKPLKFPDLVLDETKIRQIIMNFTDNAIYYTPSGGKIKVELIEKPETIEFRVTDNGIGVPRLEQKHLFTKFYRAGNARQARPDGTGLGLFMAKKVIIAQGGSVIFESKQGKGSTFGFMFSKAKTLPAASAPKA